MKILLYIALFALGLAALASIVTAASYWLTWVMLSAGDGIIRAIKRRRR